MKIIYVVTMGLLSAILVIGQVGMAALPNIEPVTMLIIAYTLVYKKKVFYIIYAFALIEGIIYGFGIWWLNYLYVWTILTLIVLAMQKTSRWSSGVLAGAYGLCFGFCVRFLILSQVSGRRICLLGFRNPYDITHCIGNVAMTGLCLSLCTMCFAKCIIYSFLIFKTEKNLLLCKFFLQNVRAEDYNGGNKREKLARDVFAMSSVRQICLSVS